MSYWVPAHQWAVIHPETCHIKPPLGSDWCNGHRSVAKLIGPAGVRRVPDRFISPQQWTSPGSGLAQGPVAVIGAAVPPRKPLNEAQRSRGATFSWRCVPGTRKFERAGRGASRCCAVFSMVAPRDE